jgi:hypothetical protein
MLDLLQKIATRAGRLSIMTAAELRLLHPDNIAGTTSGDQWKYMSRDKLIADIIFAEFEREISC